MRCLARHYNVSEEEAQAKEQEQALAHAIAKAAKRAKRDVLVHTDAAQSFGKVCVNVKELGVDLCTLVG